MRTFVVTLVLALVAAGVASAGPDSKKLVVVVAKGSPVVNISRADLKRCFLGDSVQAGGRALVPFNWMPNSKERAGFDKAVLGMSPEEAGRFWIDRKVRGQGAAPRALPTKAHVVAVVGKVPGAIGYLPADQLSPEVQPVKVDGVAYTDASYAIATP